MARETSEDIRIAILRMPEANAFLPYFRRIDEVGY